MMLSMVRAQLLQVHRALSTVQLALAQSRLSAFERQWLEVFHLKLTRLRDRDIVLTPENCSRLERLTVVVEDILHRHQRALNRGGG